MRHPLRCALIVSLLFALAPGAWSQTFTSSPGVAIPDAGFPANGAIDPITVAGAPTSVTSIRVQLNITHPNVGDLQVLLVPPTGPTIGLCLNRGGTGDNFTMTNLTSQADAIFTPLGSITIFTPPWTGFYSPEDLTNWDMVYGTDGNGTWELQVFDDTAANTGTLDSWTIEFGSSSPTADYVIIPDDNQGAAFPTGTDIVIAEFDATSGLPATIDALELFYTGTDGTQVTNVRVIADNGIEGVFEAGIDTVLATAADLSLTSTLFDLMPDLQISPSANISVVADIATPHYLTLSLNNASDVIASSSPASNQAFPVHSISCTVLDPRVVTPNSSFVQDFEATTPQTYVVAFAGSNNPLATSATGTALGTPFASFFPPRITFTDANHPAGLIQDPVSGSVQFVADYPPNQNPAAVGGLNFYYDLSALDPATDDVTFSFKFAEINSEDDPFDLVALSRNGGASWETILHNLVISPGLALDYHYVTIDLSAAVNALGGTFGDNVLIRIQEIDNFGIPTDGFAVDDVAIIASDGNQGATPIVRELTTIGATVGNGQAAANTARTLSGTPGSPSAPLKLFVTNLDLDPYTITSVPALTGTDAADFSLSVFDDRLSYPVDIYRHGCIRMEVVFSPATTGTKTAAIEFTHTDPSTPSPFVVPLTGDAAPPAVLLQVSDGATAYANGATVDFGSANIFTPAAAGSNVVIQNAGNAPLTVDLPVLSGTDPGDFGFDASAFSGGSATIGAGGTITLPVAFDPLSYGPRTATLEIGHDATNLPDPFTLSLTGTGIAPSGTETAVALVGSPAGDFDNTTSFTGNLVVSGQPTSIHSLTVELVIAHTATGDVDITLTPPGGSPITLIADEGGAGQDMRHLALTGIGDPQRDPGSTQPSVVGQSAPFTGLFTVEDNTVWQAQLFPAGTGIDPNGNWTLEVNDDMVGDDGTVIAWALQFQEELVFGPVATYDFEDAGGASTDVATTTDPDLSATDFGLFSGSPSFFSGNGSPFGISANDWAGAPGTQYFTFTLTPAAFRQLTLDALVFDSRRSNTGPDEFTVRILEDGVDTGFDPGQLAVGAGSTYTAQNVPIGLGPLFGDVEIQIIASGATSSGGTLRLDNFVVSGSVDPQPGAAPSIELERSGNPVADGGSDALGNLPVAGGTIDYTVINSGNVPLTIDAVTAVGASNVAVSSSTSLPLVVPAGGSSTLALLVDPFGNGAFNAVLEIENNTGGSTDPYDITVTGSGIGGTPEIDIVRGSSIADGGSDDLGQVSASTGSNIFTYMLDNSAGGDDLVVTGVTFSGQSNVNVSTTASFPITVGPNTAVGLAVNVQPTGNGAFSFDLEIASNDADENPYDITVSGTGTGADPEIDLLKGTSSLANGSTDPQGNLAIGQQLSLSYTISNTGTGNLDITSVAISSQSNVSASVTSTSGAQTVTPGSTTGLDLAYTISGGGPFSFDVVVTNNDANEASYTITVEGSGASGSAEIDLQVPAGTSVASGASADVGDRFIGQIQTVTITIENSGPVDLSVSSPVLSNAQNVTGLTLAGSPSSPVSSGTTTTFAAAFTVQTLGAFSFDVQLSNSDPDEGSYMITVSGTGQSPPNQPGLAVVGTTDLNANAAGGTVTALWSLSNSGIGTLVITAIDVTGSPDFRVSGFTLPISLTAGQVRVITVAYTANTAGTVSGSVELESNTAGIPGTVTSVAVTGSDGSGGGGGGGGGSSSCAVRADAAPGSAWLGLGLLVVALLLRRRKLA